jgi:hypothetical protein
VPSDSDNDVPQSSFDGKAGTAADIASGDLPANGVDVIQDFPPVVTDDGVAVFGTPQGRQKSMWRTIP